MKQQISEEELREAVRLAAESMLDSLPDRPEYEQVPSAVFRRRMEGLIRRDQRRRRVMQRLRSTAAVLALMLTLSGVWIATQPEARAAAGKWINGTYDRTVRYQSDVPYIEGDVAEYELAWRPQGYGYTVQIDGVPDAESGAIRTRAVFYCDVETQDVVVLRYGFLDEAAMVSLPLKNKNYTRSKIVLGETIVDMYMPIHDTLDSYLIWMDENTDVYFYIKAHVSQENLLRMAQSVRQVKIPQAQS